MTITVEKLREDLTDKQNNMLDGILTRNKLTLEEVVADDRLNRETTTEGYQLLQRLVERYNDGPTSGQLAFMAAWAKAFEEAGREFPVTDAHIFEADTKEKFSGLLARVINVSKVRGVKLPPRAQQEITEEHGDEEPF